jgi:NAD(P)H-flavin reductase
LVIEVACSPEIDYNYVMDKLKQLGLQMEQQMKDSLRFDQKTGFWYDKEDENSFYTEEGIRLAVYEDMKDTINFIYSDCAY